jgi:threonine-phosphate decarboxylase
VKLPAHGGDVDVIKARYGNDGDWLDFSANVNPAGPPPAVLRALRAGADDIANIMRYPNSHDRALRAALASRLDIDPTQFVIGNGSAALIEAFVRTVAPRRCVVPQPAFSEYGRALSAANCETIAFTLDPAENFSLHFDSLARVLRRERPDACLLTNPQNPSGALTSRAEMHEIVDLARLLGTALLIDEAFIDYARDSSIAGSVKDGDGAIFVLRSLTKFYAMPALRVGYGIASSSFASAITACMPSWPVTSLAADAAIAAIADETYARETSISNMLERERFAAELRTLGVTVFPSAANFLLIASKRPSAELTDTLARRHRIIVRDCSTYETLETGGFLRICVRSDDENAVLLKALTYELYENVSIAALIGQSTQANRINQTARNPVWEGDP